MKNANNNPASNKLGSGVTEEKIEEAVSKSGFPLQTRIAANLVSKKFMVQEEWCYKDIDTNEDRTTDILASRYFTPEKKGSHIYPVLNLLIECKKHELPYIFFLSDKKDDWLPNFPLLSGFPAECINVTSDDDPSSWELSIVEAFGLQKNSFMEKPPVCTSFTKCVRKGTDLDLSGEAFSSLVLPLAKAMEQLKLSSRPPDSVLYYHFHTIIAIGLLEAPMVGVNVSEQGHDFISLPWVRLIRHEPLEDTDPFFAPKVYVIELIHKDYFSDYLTSSLLPFFGELSNLAYKHEKELISGKAFASGMGRDLGMILRKG
jgi:hypothetical protein